MEVVGEIPKYNSIGKLERVAGIAAMNEPLSGYLGGEERGGFWVRALEDKWAELFGVPHAVACNSATSGLLAACAAAGVDRHSTVIVPAMTMSATAAAPALLGADLLICDVDDETFTIKPWPRVPEVAIVTNLFGHPATLAGFKAVTRNSAQKCMIIEDNAQAPLALEGGCFTGTIGDIGVFSLNVHKHFQAGEGGVCLTRSDELAWRMRMFINHSELSAARVAGLNLRMTEITAAISFAQLSRAPELVRGRIDQAERILAAIGDIPGLRKPIVRTDCRHVYYTIPFLVERDREQIVNSLRAEGVPLSEGYQPINRLPAFQWGPGPTPVADDLHDRRLFYFENCAWSPTADQIWQIGNAFQKVFGHENRNT